jgi:hypothetical protein
MRDDLPAIIKAADSLHEAIERAVPGFPRKHRHLLGQDIRKEALSSALLAQRAMMSKGAAQRQALDDLCHANDRLKQLLQMAHRLQCFRSMGHFEAIAVQARSVGRQCGALRKSQRQHPHGQNAGAFAPPAASRDTEYSRHPSGVNA